MFERILKQMREKVRNRQYVVTLHAEEEIVDDNLSIYDVESALLTGQIIERKKDLEQEQWKYLVSGSTLNGEKISRVGRISITGKLVIITVFRS